MSASLPKSLPVRWQAMLQQAALLLGVSFVLILNGSTNLLIDSQTLTYSAIVFSILAVTWLLVGQAASNPLRWPLLAWYIIYTITVIASDDPRRSLTQMLLMTQAVFLFSLSVDLAARGWSPALWLRTLLIMGALVTLVSWLGALTWYLDWRQAMPGRWLPDTLYRPDSANIIAAVMNLILMLALARLRAAENRVIRIGLILLALAAAGMLFLTSSRGGWLGCAAGLAVLALSGRKRLQSWFSTAWAWLRGKTLANWVGVYPGCPDPDEQWLASLPSNPARQPYDYCPGTFGILAPCLAGLLVFTHSGHRPLYLFICVYK